MAILRFVLDIEAENDVTNKTGEEMAEKLHKYADSVIGVQYLGEKAGETDYNWHVHRSSADYMCNDCKSLACDEQS